MKQVNASTSSLAQLPPELHALENVNVPLCRSLAPMWLPDSSAACVHTLDARGSSIQTVPTGTVLQELWVFKSDCAMQNGWPVGAPHNLAFLDVRDAS